MLVNPAYRPDWDLPGGMVEANERPEAGVARELAEELGIHVPMSALTPLCLDYVPADDIWDDTLMFVFDAGTLDEAH